jgi:hypothetical protein
MGFNSSFFPRSHTRSNTPLGAVQYYQTNQRIGMERKTKKPEEKIRDFIPLKRFLCGGTIRARSNGWELQRHLRPWLCPRKDA